MSKRTKSATVDVGLRVKERLRTRIERSARDNGVSMNAEINDRLETTFTKEELFDRIFGGPEMRRLANLWVASFAQGAGTPFDSKKATDPKTDSYLQGALAVVQALTVGMPDENQALFAASVPGRIASRAINAQRKVKGGAS